MSVGIERILKLPASSCSLSVLTFANTTSGCACDAFSKTGANPRQGPHQGAQKSTITMGLPLTTDSKLSLVSSTVDMQFSFPKTLKCTLAGHVYGTLRSLAKRVAALRLARRGARQLARCTRRGRQVARSNRGSRYAAVAPGNSDRHLAPARGVRTRMGRTGRV